MDEHHRHDEASCWERLTIASRASGCLTMRALPPSVAKQGSGRRGRRAVRCFDDLLALRIPFRFTGPKGNRDCVAPE